MKILVTGAAGFIGSNLVEFLSLEHTVTAGIHTSNEQKMQFQKRKLKELGASYIIFGDCIDGFVSSDWIIENDIDVVIYSAGQCDGIKATKEYESTSRWEDTSTMKINAFGPLKLATACDSVFKKGKNIKFIYLSSIYAENSNADVYEKPDHTPEKHYGFSKLFGEQLLEKNNIYLDITIIRLPRMIGKYQNTSAVASVLREKILFGKKPEANENIISVTPVENLHNTIINILNTPLNKGKITVVKLTPEDAIMTSPKQMAEIIDEVISQKFSLTPLWKNKKDTASQLKPLFEDIVEARAGKFISATKIIQKAWRKHRYG